MTRLDECICCLLTGTVFTLHWATSDFHFLVDCCFSYKIPMDCRERLTRPVVWWVVCEHVDVCCLPSELSNVMCTLRPWIKPGGSIFLCSKVIDFAHLLFKSWTSVQGIPTPQRFNRVVASLLPLILWMVTLKAVPNGDLSALAIFSHLWLIVEIVSASALFVGLTVA